MTGGARRLGRHGRVWLSGAGIAAAVCAAVLIPVPAALAGPGAGATSAFAAFASAAIVAFSIFPFVMWRGALRRAIWIAAAAVALGLGLGSFLAGVYVERVCTATYAGKAIVVGTELTPLGMKYREANPHQSRDEMLFDSAGDVQRIWTRASITRCRSLIGGTYFLWMPFLIASLLAAVQAMPGGPLTIAPGGEARPPAIGEVPAAYDAFISYRHGGADARVAREILEDLEADGYRVAIDQRDFRAQASFLEEIERCIRESRFTVAIVSARYLESGNCQEEAIISKVLDMDARRRRLIPFVIEAVSMPAWLYGIVGISCTDADPLVDPVEKLKAALGPPQTAPRGGAVDPRTVS
jgi:hypothetical protein